MKHFITLFLAVFLIFGCNDDDDDYNEHDYRLEYIGVTDTDLPTEFIYGETYPIDVTIELPNSCYFYYNQYDYFYEGTSRYIYPIAHIDEGVTCTTKITPVTFSIPVHVLQAEPYIFNFYLGLDDDGEEIFLTIEVPVAN